MALFLIIIFGLYASFVIVLLFGWIRSMRKLSPESLRARKVSVIVPFRNEEANLGHLLQSLKAQTYPHENFEVILVNDHSSDTSGELIEKWTAAELNIQSVDLKEAQGKKAALTAGIARARGEIIVTTDADCITSPDWLKEINRGFDFPATKMVIGAVRLEGNSFFARMQAMEMASLTGVSGGTLGWGSPSMCNGANLSFLKSSFDEVGGYQGNEGISSGDDEFLMRKFFARWSDGLRFLASPASVVVSATQVDWAGFAHQRLRWAGKWKHNTHIPTQIVAILVVFFHLVFIGSFFLSIIGQVAWSLFGFLWASKLVVEALFLFSVIRFLQTEWRWSVFFLLQFVYSFYVVSIGFASQVVTPKWKGRAVGSGV